MLCQQKESIHIQIYIKNTRAIRAVLDWLAEGLLKEHMKAGVGNVFLFFCPSLS